MHAVAVDTALVADDHQLFGGIARPVQAGKEPFGQGRARRDEPQIDQRGLAHQPSLCPATQPAPRVVEYIKAFHVSLPFRHASDSRSPADGDSPPAEMKRLSCVRPWSLELTGLALMGPGLYRLDKLRGQNRRLLAPQQGPTPQSREDVKVKEMHRTQNKQHQADLGAQ